MMLAALSKIGKLYFLYSAIAFSTAIAVFAGYEGKVAVTQLLSAVNSETETSALFDAPQVGIGTIIIICGALLTVTWGLSWLNLPFGIIKALRDPSRMQKQAVLLGLLIIGVLAEFLIFVLSGRSGLPALYCLVFALCGGICIIGIYVYEAVTQIVDFVVALVVRLFSGVDEHRHM